MIDSRAGDPSSDTITKPTKVTVMDTVVGDPMITILLSLISLFNGTAQLPLGQVEVAEAEVEAVFVPAGFEGPVVAAPFDESAF